jgi:hypothetical protein
MSEANGVSPNSSCRSATGRAMANSAAPISSPIGAATSASPAAISLACPAVAPTSRIAASRRSRCAPDSRALLTTKITTGKSSTTTPTTSSAHSSRGSGSPPAYERPNSYTGASARSPEPTYAVRSRGPASPSLPMVATCRYG